MADLYSDEEEDLCPLCIEEMDISDKNFKPCPCGYQICQFCYNSIRNEMNGRCPACRRIYDDESVEYKEISPEDIKRDHARQARREKERRQRDKTILLPQEASKKHLAGMRVIQKNLVYVIGLNPNIPTEDLHNILRADVFFGQYGKIQKIVINKRTNANGNLGLGVYVTFAKKEDAARCISCVDGSLNDGKYLRAAYGTTKYCSSYLRGQTCPNPNCMFLHEPGEEADSYTRRDLSAMQHRNPPPVVPPGLPSLTQATAPHPQIPTVSAAPLPTASAWRKPISTPALGSTPASVSAAPAPAPAPVPAAPADPSPSHTSPTPVAATTAPAPSAAQPTAARVAPGPSRGAVPTISPAVFSLPTYAFSSSFITETCDIPHYFAFNLTQEARLKQYQTHISWLAEVEALRVKKVHDTQIFEDVPQSPQQRDASSLSNPPAVASQAAQQAINSPVQTTPPPGLFGNISNSNTSSSRNSQELLAHLMKGKASSQKLNKQLNKYFEKEYELHSVVEVVKGTMKSQCQSQKQVPAVTSPETAEFVYPEARYIDDGSSFPAGEIPKIELVGDSNPSIWSGIERYTRLERQSEEAQRTVSSTQNTVKKLLKQASNRT